MLTAPFRVCDILSSDLLKGCRPLLFVPLYPIKARATSSLLDKLFLAFLGRLHTPVPLYPIKARATSSLLDKLFLAFLGRLHTPFYPPFLRPHPIKARATSSLLDKLFLAFLGRLHTPFYPPFLRPHRLQTAHSGGRSVCKQHQDPAFGRYVPHRAPIADKTGFLRHFYTASHAICGHFSRLKK